MNTYYGVKVDVSSKQSYIFSSNRLKEVVGASKIIEFTTEILGRIIIENMKSRFPLAGLNQRKFTETFDWKDDNGMEKNVRGNVHVEGGGNSIYFFKESDQAQEFTKNFTRYVLNHFDGLEVILVTDIFEFDKDLAVEFYNRLENKINKKKNSLNRPLRKISNGIYDKCGNTGKPIGYEVLDYSDKRDGEFVSKLVSKESYHKKRFYDDLLMSRYNEFDFNRDNKDSDFYNIKKYMKLDKSIIKDKILWMRSYYTSNENYQLAKILPKYYEQKTLFSESEAHQISNIDLKTRLEYIDEIAGKNSKETYIGLTQLDGNGMGDMLCSVPGFFVKQLLIHLEKIDSETSGNMKYKNSIIECKSPKAYKDDLSDNAKAYIEDHNLYFLRFQEILSEEIQKTYETAFIQMVAEKFKEETSRVVPIIMAGDDISFWSAGPESIDLSIDYIRKVSNITEELEKLKVENNSDVKGLRVRVNERLAEEPKLRNDLKDKIERENMLFNYLTVSGATVITHLSYPISQVAKIASKLEKKAKEAGLKIKAKETKDNPYSGVYDWELVRGEYKESSNAQSTGKPYLVIDSKNFEFNKSAANLEKHLVQPIEDFYKAVKSIDIAENNKNTETIKLFRAFMDDENQAKLQTSKIFSSNKYDKDETQKNTKKELEKTGILYDAIELMGLKCDYSRLKQSNDK